MGKGLTWCPVQIQPQTTSSLSFFPYGEKEREGVVHVTDFFVHPTEVCFYAYYDHIILKLPAISGYRMWNL